MNNENRYDAIALRTRTRRTRDSVFALGLAVLLVFSLGALRSAADRVEHAPGVGVRAPAPASSALEPTG